MIYFKVPANMDNTKINKNGWNFVANELFTISELAKKGFSDLKKLERVEISKRMVYFFFGARFEKKQF